MSFQCYSLNWIITKNKQQFGPVPVLGAVQLSDLNRGAALWEKRSQRSKYTAKKTGENAPSYSNNPFSRHSSTHTLLFSLLRLGRKGKKKKKLLKIGQFEAPAPRYSFFKSDGLALSRRSWNFTGSAFFRMTSSRCKRCVFTAGVPPNAPPFLLKIQTPVKFNYVFSVSVLQEKAQVKESVQDSVRVSDIHI